MLGIQSSSNGDVIFKLSGRLDEDVAELKRSLVRRGTGASNTGSTNPNSAGQDAVNFLERCGSGWHHVDKLRGLRSRVDRETATRKLARGMVSNLGGFFFEASAGGFKSNLLKINEAAQNYRLLQAGI
jgi:hypothetical protein